MQMKYRKILIFFLALAVLAAVTGCGRKDEAAAAAPLVRTQTIQRSGSAGQSSYSGEVRGRYESSLSFQVGGKIVARQVQLGSRVRAGDVLMVLDAKDIQETANKSDAQLQSAQSQLKLAESNLSRYTQLYQEAAVSAAALDQYQASYEAALASYQQAQAQAAQGHNAIGYASLTADADGVISSVAGEPGQVVAAGQTVLTLVRTDELEVEIAVPESKVAAMPLGKKVTVSFWALGNDRKIPGEVREVAPMADSSTRTYKLRIRLLDPDPDIRLGMTASVASDDGPDSAATVSLPLGAIYQTGSQPQVWLVDEEKKLHLQNVAVESFSGNEVRVSGLKNGEVVVTAGVHKLQAGQSVRLEEGALQ